MTEVENVFTARKKFKSSHEKSDDISSGILKGNAGAEAGNYFLGPVIKKLLKAPVTQCLARRKGTDDYYLMKILLLDDSSDKCSFVRRTVFHNEYSFLTLLRNHPGVIQLRDFFKDYIYEELSDKKNKTKLKRICMVLECLIPHGHHNTEFVLLNHYLKEDRLSECEALYIFYNLLLVIEDLHKRNIIHRDLKLSNIILNRKTLKVKLIDFYYAKLLTSNNEVQYNQGRTSSYSSTDVLTGHPVLPKTCDMWSAGVILYAMLNGCMPFANAGNCGSSLSSSCSLRDLYLKIMENDCTLSNNTCISDGTKELLRNILWKIPQFRLKASEAVDVVSTLLALQCTSQNPSLFTENKCSDQVVPECPEFDSKEQQVCTPVSKKKASPVASDFAMESENDKKSIEEKAQKSAKTDENSDRTPLLKLSLQNDLLNRKEVKCAILRLGVTSKGEPYSKIWGRVPHYPAVLATRYSWIVYLKPRRVKKNNQSKLTLMTNSLMSPIRKRKTKK